MANQERLSLVRTEKLFQCLYYLCCEIGVVQFPLMVSRWDTPFPRFSRNSSSEETETPSICRASPRAQGLGPILPAACAAKRSYFSKGLIEGTRT